MEAFYLPALQQAASWLARSFRSPRWGKPWCGRSRGSRWLRRGCPAGNRPWNPRERQLEGKGDVLGHNIGLGVKLSERENKDEDKQKGEQRERAMGLGGFKPWHLARVSKDGLGFFPATMCNINRLFTNQASTAVTAKETTSKRPHHVRQITSLHMQTISSRWGRKLQKQSWQTKKECEKWRKTDWLTKMTPFLPL